MALRLCSGDFERIAAQLPPPRTMTSPRCPFRALLKRLGGVMETAVGADDCSDA